MPDTLYFLHARIESFNHFLVYVFPRQVYLTPMRGFLLMSLFNLKCILGL